MAMRGMAAARAAKHANHGGDSAAEELQQGLGVIGWWGLSPAMDLVGEANKAGAKPNPAKVDMTGKTRRDVLIVGGCDPRHILKTLAMGKRRPAEEIHFWISEPQMDLVARQLLLLALALEPADRVGLQEKVEMYLELLGNAHVRAKTSEYLARKAELLTDLVTDPEACEQRYPLVDIAGLKFRERDDIEAVLSFWRNPKPKEFDMKELWDFRLRTYLKQRFDAKRNLADWDYSMKLKDMASIIHVKQFTCWRELGLGFCIRDAPYDVPNRTLGSGRVFREKSGSVERRGYWGDIVTGPYIGIGVDCEETKFFEQRNKQHVKSTVDVAQYNMSAYVHEIFTGAKYDVEVADAPGFGEPDEQHKVEEVDEAADLAPAGPGAGGAANEDAGGITFPLPDVKVHFLPLASCQDWGRKSKYRGRFDVAFFSNQLAGLLKPETRPMLAPDATVFIESARFVLDFRPENKDKFLELATDFAKGVGATPLKKHNGQSDNFFCFRTAPAPAEEPAAAAAGLPAEPAAAESAAAAERAAATIPGAAAAAK